MTREALAANGRSFRHEVAPRRQIQWGTILRHVVLAIFALIIILPLVWVMLLSVKSLPDAYQNDIWPKKFDWSALRTTP